MTAEELVRARLLSVTALTTLVSTRISVDKLPQTPTYPCVRVTLISEATGAHMRGGEMLRSARVQVDAYARETSGVDPYALAVAVADAIHGDDAGSGLSGFAGGIGSPAIYVLGIFRLDRRRYYDPEELRVLTMSQDYQVHYRA